MPVLSGSTHRYRKSGGSGGGSGDSALSLYKKIGQGMEDKFAAENDGVTINDPYYLNQLVDFYSNAYPFAKDAGDRLDIDNKIGKYKAQISSLERKISTENVSSYIDVNMKDARVGTVSKNANNPLRYLADNARNYKALYDISSALVDELVSSNRPSEADKIINKFKDLQDELKVWNTVDQLYDSNTGELINGMVKLPNGTEVDPSQEIKNYAVVYRTDRSGRVLDMGIRRTTGLNAVGGTDDIGNGIVPLYDNNGQEVTYKGMPIFLNQQDEGGAKVVKLGNQTASIGQTYAQSTDPLFVPSTTTMAKLSVESPDWESMAIRPVDPNVVDKSPTYAELANGRIFRFNSDDKWDEIAPNALDFFPDYNKNDSIKAQIIDANIFNSKSGKYLTENDLIPYTPTGGKPEFRIQSDAQPSDLTPQTTFTGGQSMAGVTENAPLMSTEARTNRAIGMTPYVGQDKFNKNTQSLFSGNPAPASGVPSGGGGRSF